LRLNDSQAMTTGINYETKVLVLDHFASTRYIICNLLKEIGFKHIVEADDVALAISVIRKENIGLFIADWDLPKISGLELLRHLRQDAHAGNVLVLLATAKGFKAEIVEAMKAGADDCLFKPFTADNLKRKIEQIFRKRSIQPVFHVG